MLTRQVIIYCICSIFILSLSKIFLFQNVEYYQYFLLFYLILTACIVKIFFSRDSVLLLSLSFIYLIIIQLVYGINFSVNEFGFFPFFDDSFYFNQGVEFFRGNYSFDSIFDFITISTMFFPVKNELSLIGFNWFLSIVILGLVLKMSRLINPNFKNIYIYILAFNMLFLESMVVYLRDFFAIFFLMLALIKIFEKNKKFNIYALLSMLVRPGTGVVAYMFYFIYNNKFFNKNYKGKFFIISLFLLCVYFVYNLVPLGIFIGRSGGSDIANLTLASISSARQDEFIINNDLTSYFVNLGVLAFPILFILNTLTPLKVQDLSIDRYLYLFNGRTYEIFTSSDTLNYLFILSIFHVAVYCFVPLLFISGLINIFKNKIEKGVLVSYLFITLSFLVTFVSFQPRHKLMYLILLPVICSFSKIPLKINILFGLLLMLVNFVVYGIAFL